jgi:NADH-quinone oxidoreductase subunit L
MTLKVRSKLPGWISVICLAASFVTTVVLYQQTAGIEGKIIPLFDWFNLHWSGGSFVANFSLYVDGTTLLWMLFVTGLSTLIALYATEYMEADVGAGYARFFAGVSIFVFAMSALVMGDNLVMLYLGWEGVGFASYWLIGYYYQRPSAVAAAKKAFIVNRIGDLGLALAIWLIYHNFGTVEFESMFEALDATQHDEVGGWSVQAIPFLLMLGAFGKSAQLPLYVWLPDAMEGPTPVSALIHAATMVTAGLYLMCRMFPFMELHPAALPTVAWVGGLTALLSATIGMAQYDIKRIMAYSTVSQLGYMFLGIGVLSTVGAATHVFTHAFFKAVLFLTCGAIMHGFAGQLDLRRISGLRRMSGWGITTWTMLFACLCLAGFPFTPGYYSKDAIIAEAFYGGYTALGVIAMVGALLTAYYTFRVWFRVCAGPERYEMGDDHHGGDGHDDHSDHGAHDKPHAPRIAINLVLLTITAGSVLSLFLIGSPVGGAWTESQIAASTAKEGIPEAHHGGWVPYAAAGLALVGILIAAWFHLWNRKAADTLRAALLGTPLTRWLPTAMENKWYVDEIYIALIRTPLWVLGHLFSLVDRYLVDGLLVDGIARLPRMFGRSFQPLQNGVLQSYGVAMAGLSGLMAILVLGMPTALEWLNVGLEWFRGIINGGGGGA